MNIKNVAIKLLFIIALFVSCNEEVANSAGSTEESVSDETPAERTDELNNETTGLSTYNNDRFNFCMHYPAQQYRVKGEQQNSDGNTFISNDGKVEIQVYGYHNVLEQSIQEIYENDLRNAPEKKISYRDIQKGKYLLSGEKNGRNFIEKRVLQNGEVKVIEAVFPKDQAQQYEQGIKEIIEDFPSCEK